MHRAATHHFRRKKLCREHGEEEKNEPKPHHTAQHDTIIPQNHNTSYHIISHHITTISKPDNTTNIQNLIPYLKHHTPPHIQQKPFPKKGGRALLKYIRANWASNLLDSRAYRRPKPAIARSNYIVPDQPVPSTDRIP